MAKNKLQGSFQRRLSKNPNLQSEQIGCLLEEVNRHVPASQSEMYSKYHHLCCFTGEKKNMTDTFVVSRRFQLNGYETFSWSLLFKVLQLHTVRGKPLR